MTKTKEIKISELRKELERRCEHINKNYADYREENSTVMSSEFYEEQSKLREMRKELDLMEEEARKERLNSPEYKKEMEKVNESHALKEKTRLKELSVTSATYERALRIQEKEVTSFLARR